MAKIRTVLGDIRPEDVGFTYTHEHLISHPPKWRVDQDPDLELPDVDKAIEELKSFQAAGGKCLVEGSTIDYGRDVRALKFIASHVPVHIVATTGFNKGAFYPDWVKEMSVDDVTGLLVREIEEGIDGTDVRAGQIKIGSSYNVITREEEKISRAAARAHKITGAPIWVHTELGTMGLEQLDLLQEEGADLSKVAVGHLDRNPDPRYHLEILKRGAYVQLDCVSKVKYHPESVTVELIKNVLAYGYGDRLLVSGDMGRKSYFRSYGGGPGFEYIITKFVGRLLDEGFSPTVVSKIFIENPARWLQF